MIHPISENVGWSCPKCGYCYSPVTTDCGNCNRPDSEKYKMTTTYDPCLTTTKVCMCADPGPGLKFGTHCKDCGGLINNYTVTAT